MNSIGRCPTCVEAVFKPVAATDKVRDRIFNGPPLTTSYWLSDALKAALKREPIDAAHDAKQHASILTLRAQEQTANALAWLAVQWAQGE